MSENKDFEALQAEKDEIRRLINHGISVLIKYTESKTVKLPRWNNRLGKLLKRKVTTNEEKQREYVIKEPTLFTLDRLSLEYIELQIDEGKIKESPRQQSRLYFKEYDNRMARIVAIAILGNDWEDSKKLDELTTFLFKWLTNSQLADLIKVIDLTNNLADFINSIRLISSARTTMPNLVESNED